MFPRTGNSNSRDLDINLDLDLDLDLDSYPDSDSSSERYVEDNFDTAPAISHDHNSDSDSDSVPFDTDLDYNFDFNFDLEYVDVSSANQKYCLVGVTLCGCPVQRNFSGSSYDWHADDRVCHGASDTHDAGHEVELDDIESVFMLDARAERILHIKLLKGAYMLHKLGRSIRLLNRPELQVRVNNTELSVGMFPGHIPYTGEMIHRGKRLHHHAECRSQKRLNRETIRRIHPRIERRLLY